MAAMDQDDPRIVDPETLIDEERSEFEDIQEDRKRRLDPENRPDSTEVDNTQRDFDTSTGTFTDSEPNPELGPFDDDAV